MHFGKISCLREMTAVVQKFLSHSSSVLTIFEGSEVLWRYCHWCCQVCCWRGLWKQKYNHGNPESFLLYRCLWLLYYTRASGMVEFLSEFWEVFFISQWKCMLWPLIRTISVRWFWWYGYNMCFYWEIGQLSLNYSYYLFLYTYHTLNNQA